MQHKYCINNTFREVFYIEFSLLERLRLKVNYPRDFCHLERNHFFFSFFSVLLYIWGFSKTIIIPCCK